MKGRGRWKGGGSRQVTVIVLNNYVMRVGCTGDKLLERYGMTETGMVVSNPYQGDSCLALCPII